MAVGDVTRLAIDLSFRVEVEGWRRSASWRMRTSEDQCLILDDSVP